MSQWLYLAIAILAEVFATSMLKLSNGFTRLIPSACSIIGYMVSFYCLSQTLKTMPVGIAYAVWSGIGIVCVSLIAWVKFGQKLDLAAIIGIGFILVGVLVINLLSKSMTH
ncbi:QacE family quaternary ammonium compound efflux SMR transporter [Snodgrassella sp. B3882]|uniref:DMT family transporter n=1 Tax=Snodgrassella sp. B3882 TaxID=2818037 RepID=UPI00226A5F73|nr:SMR family transporter [Snodgrassella sp. B3882]MCX8745005.1 QacE family quaternary ammonium compound efflux SMR transporter [Snodgrassella sp. B3882]